MKNEKLLLCIGAIIFGIVIAFILSSLRVNAIGFFAGALVLCFVIALFKTLP